MKQVEEWLQQNVEESGEEMWLDDCWCRGSIKSISGECCCCVELNVDEG